MFEGLKWRRQIKNDIPSVQLSKNTLDPALGSWWPPNLGGPLSIIEYGRRIGVIRKCRDLFDHLSEDEYLTYVKAFYDKGLELYGECWIFQDINTVLMAGAQLLKPQSYLEIGVRRGRSTAMVVTQHPECSFVGFDMWIENYAGMDNPGPDFVRSELTRLGHVGSCQFINGDSLQTVPKYFSANPEEFFDIITVDGDHSVRGALKDLRNVKERVKIGGLLVFDDTANNSHPGLADVWHRAVASDARFAAAEYNEVGFGIGIAVRRF